MFKTLKLNEKGSGLLEVLLSIFLIGVSFILFQASINAILLNKDIKNNGLALRIAQSKIEALRNTPYAGLPTSGNFTDPELTNLKNGSATVTVSDSGLNTKTITVVVSWTNQYSGVDKNVTLSTIMTQGGL